MNELSLFNRFFNGDLYDGFVCKSAPHLPQVDVKEAREAYTMEMDLPGKNENDVHIELDNNVLSISSKKEELNEKVDEKENGKWLIKERRSSEFARRFVLPEDVDAENVKANFKNGVLTVTLPRKAVSVPKKIEITAA